MGLFDFFDFAKSLVEKLGYFGVFLGTFLESLFPPIPSEIVMAFSGFLISEKKFAWFPTILAAVAGNAISVSIIWLVGRTLGKEFLLRFGKYGGISANDIQSGERLFEKYGYKMVFFCQMVPMARTLIAVPAGVLKTEYPKFILANSLGATIWFTLLAYVGYIFGNRWEEIETIAKPYEKVILVVLALLFLFLLYKWFLNFQKNKSLEENQEK